MDINELKEIAFRFRHAVDVAFEDGAFSTYPFNNFPYECCDDMCDLLGQFLFEKNVLVLKVSGIYRYDYWNNNYPHTWLSLQDGLIIDLTGDQFKDDPIMLNNNDPCYVGKENKFYKLFPMKERTIIHYYGIENYINDNPRIRLWELYNTILIYYKDIWGE